jgi:hypothetical protein
MIKILKTLLLCIKKPSYLTMNHPYDERLDIILNELMDRHTVVIEDRYHARFGKVMVWICNYPYAFGTIRGRYSCKRASRLTIEKLNNLVKDKQLEFEKKSFDKYDREILGL